MHVSAQTFNRQKSTGGKIKFDAYGQFSWSQMYFSDEEVACVYTAKRQLTAIQNVLVLFKMSA